MTIAVTSASSGLPGDRSAPETGERASFPGLDDIDLALLRALVADARTSQRGLARQVGMSPPAVGERISRLERFGIIRGYRADVDYAVLGAPLVVYIGIVAVQGADQPDLVRSLRAFVEVESVEVITGSLDLFVRLRVRDHAHLRDVLFSRMWALPGVNRTETFISLDSMEPKDFGSHFLDAVLAERAAVAAGRAGRDADGG